VNQELDELATKLKPIFGSGWSHNIYSTGRYPDKLIKVEKQPGMVNRWYDMFSQYPNLFPKVYNKGVLKLKNDKGEINDINYVLIEKLETKPFVQLWMHIEQYLDTFNKEFNQDRSLLGMMHEHIMHVFSEEPSELMEKFLNFIKEKNGEDYIKFNMFINLIDQIVEIYPSADVHKNQFGYLIV
jgi:hypothetical protein